MKNVYFRKYSEPLLCVVLISCTVNMIFFNRIRVTWLFSNTHIECQRREKINHGYTCRWNFITTLTHRRHAAHTYETGSTQLLEKSRSFHLSKTSTQNSPQKNHFKKKQYSFYPWFHLMKHIYSGEWKRCSLKWA